MKFLTIFTSLMIAFCALSFSQEKTYAFKGQVHAYGKTLKDVKVEVYAAGDLIDESLTKAGGRFSFDLPAEQDFMVEITMESLQSKTIWISTRNTGDLSFSVPTFGFDVYLKKEKVTPYGELNEIPVTFIKYQAKKKVFYMDKTYEEALKNKEKRIKEEDILKMR